MAERSERSVCEQTEPYERNSCPCAVHLQYVNLSGAHGRQNRTICEKLVSMCGSPAVRKPKAAHMDAKTGPYSNRCDKQVRHLSHQQFYETQNVLKCFDLIVMTDV